MASTDRATKVSPHREEKNPHPQYAAFEQDFLICSVGLIQFIIL